MDRERVILLGLALLTGCSSLPEEVGLLKKEVAALQREVQEARGIGEEVRARQEGLERRLADEGAEREEVTRRVEQLQGALAELKAPSPLPPSPRVEEVTPENPRPAPQPAVARGYRELFDAAMRNLEGRQYGQAILEFEEFLRRFPNSVLAMDAQYGVGEAYFRQGNYRRAVEEFGKMIRMSPEGARTAGAHLRRGEAYLRLGERSNALREFGVVTERFSKSPEAAAARKHVQELEQGSRGKRS